ncbi:unnamed protein product [Phytomonas sp. Hart1]|nr:unnamed protein product [Phytomonas sp. Hart1]|eukprot:CCW72168.1 unnamed protein product [Phytomonas sp. isolate Hart1]
MATGNISDTSLKYFEEKKIKILLDEAFHDLLVAMPDDPLNFLLKTFSRPTGLRLMIAGLSGSEKSAHSKLLAKKYGVRHISAGDVLRKASTDTTRKGQEIASYLKRQALVPDKLFIDLIFDEIRAAKENGNGWILEGIPRTRSQAIYLQSEGIFPQRFFYLDVTNETAALRLAKNRNINSRPPSSSDVPNMDTASESPVLGLNNFKSQYHEVIECYESFFVRINGERPIEEVHEELCAQVDSVGLPP